MIHLITGLPGSGKTLYTLWHLDQLSKKENRPVYYFGIPEVKIPGWTEFKDAKEWKQLPPRSILIVDECQDVFPIRASSKEPPEFVQDLSKHRHFGLDIFIMTQHPMMIDTYVRRLVDTHWHVVNIFGAQRATVYQFKGVRTDVEQNREGAISRLEWSYPKEYYDLYKSATVHTRKRQIPAKVYFLFAAPLAIGSLIYFSYQSLYGSPAISEPAKAITASAPLLNTAQASKQLTAHEFVASVQPRILDLPQTAPRYDPLQQPVAAPKPVSCIKSSSRGCRCYSQQATPLDIPQGTCEQYVTQGWFDDTQDSIYKPSGDRDINRRQPEPPSREGGGVSPA